MLNRKITFYVSHHNLRFEINNGENSTDNMNWQKMLQIFVKIIGWNKLRIHMPDVMILRIYWGISI